MPITRRELLIASGITSAQLAVQTQLVAPAIAWAANPSESPPTFQETTPASDKAICKADEWLLKTITNQGGCGVDIGQTPDVGCTSMVGLALLAQGNTPIEGPQSRELRRIVSYLLGRVDAMPNDDVTSEQGTQLQNKIGRHAHSFFAALFLAEVLGEGYDPEPVRQALRKVVAAITDTQTPEGHWGNQSWAPTLGTVMGWVSLRAAHYAGIKVGNSPETTAQHLVQQMSANLAQENGSWMHTLYKNATGVRVLYALGRDDDPVAKKAFADVLALVKRDNTAFSQAGGEEFLAFHLITETMLQKGGADWETWFTTARDKIVGVQNADGSWTGHHCITSRTFCTAAAVLVLSSPNRYLPISQA